MGSIFGCLHIEKQDREEISQNMIAGLSSRGGDTKAVYHDQNVIIGIRGSAEEVKIGLVLNPNKSVIAAIEGEIYNLTELINFVGFDKLEFKQGNKFGVIVALYEKYGEEFPRYLNGIFTIVLWDKDRRKLYLIRDHLGSHSLFYTEKKNQIFFASTLQALLKTGRVSREISLSALNTYLSSTAICPPNTLVNNIFCLRPGTIGTYLPNNNFIDKDYWPIKSIRENYDRSIDDFAEEVRTLILDAITIRAQYGNSYGSLLSGGIDTSIITAKLAELYQDIGKKLPVFSIVFKEKIYSDAALQKIMYARYPIEPYTATVTPQEFSEILQKAIAYLDTPVNDVALVGMYKAFELAKQVGCTVVFEGEAADEIFYTGHAHAERQFQRYLRIPYEVRRILLGKTITTIPLGDSIWKKGLRFLYRLGLPDNERRLIGLPNFYKHATPILLNQETLQTEDPFVMGKKYIAEASVRDPVNIYYYGLLKMFLPDDLLFKNERMASAHGITNRTPFIDYRLVELAYKIPQRLKIKAPTKNDDGTKLVYKKAIQGLIPNEILNRKKIRGFSQPSAVWYRNELKDFLYETLFSHDSQCQNYLNKKYMLKLFTQHVNEQTNYDYLLNSLLIFELWLRAFL